MSFEVRKKMILDLTKAPGTRRVSQRLAKGWGSGGHTTTPRVPAGCLPFFLHSYFFFSAGRGVSDDAAFPASSNRHPPPYFHW